MALWTYTIVPLPDPTTMVCSGATRAQLVPLASLRDVDLATNGLRDPALVQLVANVALFVPFGMLVRHLAAPNRLGRFGCIVVAGAGVSLLIELTQLTGVWGLYPCSYRLFDVDDLLTNTVGVVIGVALAPLRLVPAVHSLTLLVYLPVAIAAREAGWFGADVPYDRLRGWTMLAVAGLLLLGVPLLARGATIGQLLTYVRPVTSEGRAPSTTARLVRWVTGSGGYFVLSSLELITGQGVLGSIAAGSLVLSCAEVALRHPGGDHHPRAWDRRPGGRGSDGSVLLPCGGHPRVRPGDRSCSVAAWRGRAAARVRSRRAHVVPRVVTRGAV